MYIYNAHFRGISNEEIKQNIPYHKASCENCGVTRKNSTTYIYDSYCLVSFPNKKYVRFIHQIQNLENIVYFFVCLVETS